jgi:hypothetical protein
VSTVSTFITGSNCLVLYNFSKFLIGGIFSLCSCITRGNGQIDSGRHPGVTGNCSIMPSRESETANFTDG